MLMEIKCLQCGLPVPQTAGKRKKEYCNSTCRTTFWKKKKEVGKVKKGPGRPKKMVIDPVKIQAKIAEVKASLKDLPVLRGNTKAKSKIEPFNPDNLQAEVAEVFGLPDAVADISKGSDTRPPGYAIDVEKCPNRNFEKVIESLPKIERPETPYPSNWDSLGKVARLQWLTEHRKR